MLAHDSEVVARGPFVLRVMDLELAARDGVTAQLATGEVPACCCIRQTMMCRTSPPASSTSDFFKMT